MPLTISPIFDLKVSVDSFHKVLNFNLYDNPLKMTIFMIFKQNSVFVTQSIEYYLYEF